MKRLGLLFLAVVLAFGVTGCKKDKDADPVGTWVMIGDTGCNGTTFNLVLHIYDNGTFLDSDNDSGLWSVNKKDITLSYTTFGIALSGEVDGDQMRGTWVGVSTGCWTAQRTSEIP